MGSSGSGSTGSSGSGSTGSSGSGSTGTSGSGSTGTSGSSPPISTRTPCLTVIFLSLTLRIVGSRAVPSDANPVNRHSVGNLVPAVAENPFSNVIVCLSVKGSVALDSVMEIQVPPTKPWIELSLSKKISTLDFFASPVSLNWKSACVGSVSNIRSLFSNISCWVSTV